MPATDFQEEANLRMLWFPRGAQDTLRDGIEDTGNPLVVEFYAKSSGRQDVDMPGIRAGALKLRGYLTRWAPLPAGIPLAIVGVEREGTLATLTFALARGRLGQRIRVSGLTGLAAPLNGAFTITAITPTTISFVTPASGAIASGAATGEVRLTPAIPDWLAAGDSWAWEEGGASPGGFMPGAEGAAYWGDLESLPAIVGELGRLTILELGGSFGFGGIGAEIRAEAGDGIAAGFSSLA
jgi:hypothetical protein